MDTLRALEHLSNVLTVDEWREFTQTDEYLWMVARTEGYRGKAMEELVRRGSKRRQEAWLLALDMARSIVIEDLRDSSSHLPSEQVRRVEQTLAEHLLVEQDIIPPTYTAWSDCQQCGKVPVPEGSSDVLPVCPWCAK